MTDQFINDLSDLRKYRTELPNLYDDYGLDPFEFRLLAHYKRVGTCTEGIATTARICNMREGKVSECRQALFEKGLIELVKVSVPNGFSYRINVEDKWLENFARYSGKSIRQIKDALDRLDPSPREGYPSPHEGKPSPGETKNTPPLNKNAFQLYEENIGPLTPIIADGIKDACDFYTEEWVKDAIQESAVSNKRGWKYIEAILKGRKERGGMKEKPAQTTPTRTPMPKGDPDKKLVTPALFKRRHTDNYLAGAGRTAWGFQCTHPVLLYGKDPFLQDGLGGRPNSLKDDQPNPEKIDHPCPKPLAWMRWAVARSTRIRETILDPFMGSGTTGVACAQLWRKFIGIEIERRYFDIACERIENAYRQAPMFPTSTREEAYEQRGIFA